MEATIAPEVMARYRRTAQARELAQRQQVEGRRQAAWTVARQAARVLREEFGATRVIAFGSLAHGAWFGPHSDIDLAVEGVPADDSLLNATAAQYLLPTDNPNHHPCSAQQSALCGKKNKAAVRHSGPTAASQKNFNLSSALHHFGAGR